MLPEKEKFLKSEYVQILKNARPGLPAKWGKMDLQQMVEHMRDVFKVANGKIVLPLLTIDPEKLARQREFIMTDIPFRENTRVPVMPEEPRPHKYASMEEAIAKLEPELADVFAVYTSGPGKTTMNPIFGELNYEQQVNLLHKHALHHLRQFGLAE